MKRLVEAEEKLQ